MENRTISNHSERTKNYIRSLIEVGEPVEEKEFIETYKKLSEGRRKGFNARHSFKRLSKEKLVKFI